MATATADIGPGSVRDLSRDECLTSLRQSTLGRLAVSEGALPLILPVNYAMDGATIVFRTRLGGLLDRTCRNTIVAFEIDSYDESSRSGWSVVVVGVANVVDTTDRLHAGSHGLTSAGAADGTIFVKVIPGTVTGRTVSP